MNSMRSVSSLQPQSNTGQHFDQTDMAQTPSIDSISSITFNMQSSPSPQQISSSYISSQPTELFHNEPQRILKPIMTEPSPMPRQQISHSRHQDYNSVERLYEQRYSYKEGPLEDFLQNAIILPPPPMSKQSNYITPILTDYDLDRLRVPPPPKITQ